jgi:DNA polymerase-3 subunit delta'
MRQITSIEKLLHPASLQRLRSAAQLRHHAYLVEGEGEQGAEQAAMWLLQQQDPNLTEAEVVRVVPATSTVTISQVRELIDHLWRTPARADGIRAGIVLQAERMSIEAANALLKILEEPPQRAVIVLAASSAERLPSTVRSRVLTVPLLPLSDQQLSEFMEHHGGVQAEVLTMAQGLPLRALELQGDPEVLESHQLIKKQVEDFAAGSINDRFAIITDVSKTGSPEAFVLSLLYTFSEKFSILERSADVEAVLRCLRAIRAHVQPKLALEWLALQLS